MFGLVEGLRYLPRQHRVHRTDNNQEDGIREGDHIRGIDVRGTNQKVILSGRIVIYSSGRRDNHPDSVYEDLKQTVGDNLKREWVLFTFRT